MAGFGAKVKLKVDDSAAARTEFNNQIQKLIDKNGITINIRQLALDNKAVGAFRKSIETRLNTSKAITLSKINCKPAVDDMRSQLQSMINSLSVKNGVTISGIVDPNGVGEIATDMDRVSKETEQATKSVRDFSAEIKTLNSVQHSVSSAQTKILGLSADTDEDMAKIKQLIELQNKLQREISETKEQQNYDDQHLKNLQAQAVELNSLVQSYKDAQKAAKQKAASDEKAAKSEESRYKKIADLITRIQKMLNNNSRLSKSDLGGELRGYLDQLRNGAITTDEALAGVQRRISEISAQAVSTGKMGNTVLDSLYKAYQKFGGWSLVTRSLGALLRVVKQMISNVVELDAAMTELRKVTDESESTYERFFVDATKRAKELGAAVTDVINASANFARLGYNIGDAAALADAALVYKNVGDGITDITEASESIISTMQAFGIEAENAMIIVDKFNSVGNNFAISSGGVGDALMRSASAMDAAGNSLDETIALVTAANTVIQNPESVGTALKTISMYLRAAKTDAENAGESTEGMAESVSELRDEILSLTGQRVDIQIDENNFKSTYQILKELSSVWDELTDVSKANILELIGGKRNANVAAALLENFELAEDVIKTSAEASGSALEENEKYLDSINGKLAQFQAAFETLSATVVNSDIVKVIVDIGTALVNVLNFMGKIGVLLPAIVSLVIALNTARSKSKITSEISSITSNVVNEVMKEMQATEALKNEIQNLDRAKKELLKTELKQKIVSGELKGVTIEQIAATYGLNTAQVTLDASSKSLKDTFLMLKAANPFWWLELIIAAIPAIIKLFDWLIVTSEEAYGKAQEHRDAYNEIQSGVESLNSELETNKQRIEELQALYDSGTMTLVEQDELNNLKETNAELAIRIARQKELAEIEAKEADKDYKDSFNKLTFDNPLRLVAFGQVDSFYEKNYDVIEKYMRHNSSLYVEWAEGELEQAAAIYAEYERLSNEVSATSIAESLDPTEYTAKLVDAYRYIATIPAEQRTEAEFEFLNSLRSDALAWSDQLQDYIDNYTANDETKALMQALLRQLNAALFPSEYLAEIGVTSHLEELGRNSQLTGEYINQLIMQYPELGYWMTQNGVSADELSDRYNALAAGVDEASASAAKFKLLASGFATAVERTQELQAALDKLPESGQLDLDTYLDLIEILPEAAGEIHDVESAQRALTAAIKDERDECITAYSKMVLANENWLEETINSNDALRGALAGMYESDVANWQRTADAKWVIDSTLVKNLSELWAKYSGYTTDELEVLLAAYEARGFTEEHKKIADGIRAVLELRQELEDGWDSLSKNTGSSKNFTAYIADIDAYREALERLRKAEERVSGIELAMDNTDDLKEQIRLRRQLSDAYYEQQMALHNLNNERDVTIQAGVDRLNKLGFDATYDAVNNELWIDNIEMLNQLQATSQGTYGSMQEATNAYRKEIEDLISELENLNDENRESSATWHELQSRIEATATDLYDLLDQVIQKASESVDEIQNVYSTLHNAADEYAQSGFITIDSMQAIIGLGHKYINFLMDENGQLVINEERIRDVVAARTEQYAIETSLAYVEALRVATEAKDVATLNELLYATNEAADATWGLVYANLALLHLDDGQYQAALNHINAIRAMADSAIMSIGQTTGSALSGLQDMQNGVDSILQYVMDMLRDQLDREIDAIEEQKSAISDLIDLKKEAMDKDKEEADYQDEIADKLKEISKIQAKIDALALDDSREAQAERAKLMEELAELQDELNEMQSDKAVEAQKEALDQMNEDYANEKDAEIEKLEESLSSQEKLYRAAIQYIQDHWNTLYNELIAWNTEYGSVLNDEITSAWNNCLAAAQRYGGYVSALHNLPGDIEGAQNAGGNYQIGNSYYGDSHTNEDGIRASVKKMKENAERWSEATGESNKALRDYLAEENYRIATEDLPRYGLFGVTRGDDGVWYLPDGRKLFDVYSYHTGGIVGGGTAENRERLSLLLDDEWVLSKKMIANLVEQMDRISLLTNCMRKMPSMDGFGSAMDGIRRELNTVTGAVTTTNQPVDISFGDIIIHGRADDGVVEKIQSVNRDFANQIIKIIQKK